MKALELFFNEHTTTEIAQYLLGMYLVHETSAGVLAGYIVDTEAYLGEADEAAHSFGRRQTPRLRAMYDKPGTIYIYTMHTHLILNIVTQEKGTPEGVMIRALQPVEGLSVMRENRGGIDDYNLSNGPGKLTKALGIQRTLYQQSIFSSALHLVPEKRKFPKQILALPRIGIPNKGIWTALPLRYAVAGNPYLSLQKKAQIDPHHWGWMEEKDE